MATNEEALAAGQTAAAQASGIAAAAQAQAIASRAQPSSFFDYLTGGYFLTDVRNDVSSVASGITSPVRDATNAVDSLASAAKWIGIGILVFLTICALLYFIILFTGAKWAFGLLSTILPTLAKNARVNVVV